MGFRALWASLVSGRREERAFVPTAVDSALLPDDRRDTLVDAAIRAAGALNITILSTARQLADELATSARNQLARPVLCELDGGVLTFASAAFPDLGDRIVFAKHFMREPAGRGAHFDVYGELLDPEFPYLGVYNIAGTAALNAFQLPEALAQRYGEMHPEPTDAAYDTRRQLAAEALTDPSLKLIKGLLHRGSGVILPQCLTGPHWVHDIVPTDPGAPGQFVKLLVPAASSEARLQLTERGYASLDRVLTAALNVGSDDLATSSESLPDHRRRCNLD